MLPIWGFCPSSWFGWSRVCRETLIFKTGIFQIWLDINMRLLNFSSPMHSFSKNSGGKLQEQEALVFQFLLQKFLSLFLWYLWNYWSSVSKISHWDNLACPWSNIIGFIKIYFTNLDLWSFSHSDLLQNYSKHRSCTACHMWLFHLLVMKFGPQKLKYILFL